MHGILKGVFKALKGGIPINDLGASRVTLVDFKIFGKMEWSAILWLNAIFRI